MVLVQYNENSYAIYGTQSTLYKEELMDAPLFGKYNRNLRDGPGWIFSKKRKEALEQFIATVNKK